MQTLFTPEGHNMLNLAHVNGLTVHISTPTRITPNSQTVLGQFVSNMPQMISPVNVAPPVSTNGYCTFEAHLLFRKERLVPI